jgi:hypothetical protein
MHTIRVAQHSLSVLLIGFVAGCTSGAQIESSPLATWNPSSSTGFLASTPGTGTLTIEEDCVRLLRDEGEPVLLVWPEPTSWDASRQVIKLVDFQGNEAELRHNDRITPEGSSPIGTIPFVVEPAESCQAGALFIVNSINEITADQ